MIIITLQSFNTWILLAVNVQSDIKAVAVTGTPGCGKTTLCQSLPFNSVSVEDLAIKHGCISPADEDGARPIDIGRLAKIWQKPDEITLIDGHLSHQSACLLPGQRCRFGELRRYGGSLLLFCLVVAHLIRMKGQH